MGIQATEYPNGTEVGTNFTELATTMRQEGVLYYYSATGNTTDPSYWYSRVEGIRRTYDYTQISRRVSYTNTRTMENNTAVKVVGHQLLKATFAQVICKGTTQVGCAVPNEGFFACAHDPVGLLVGEDPVTGVEPAHESAPNNTGYSSHGIEWHV
ncbi:hypothetical protein SAICODRAFT_229198 [Saitoella complicata NRRL Y-17804]|nr:uncharacterized protein SAICODRAFT_229198 [Saitoella complicata NRRL Y-17804]ODQ54006.1 hypothetical protein SAICODRAFT_229198 [Saitoella complicata NRRL Y-17804]